MRLYEWTQVQLKYRDYRGPLTRSMRASIDGLLDDAETLVRAHDARLQSGQGQSALRGPRKCKHAHVYLRAGSLFYAGKLYYTVELSSINVREKYQGRGFATTLLGGLEALAAKHERLFIVDNVLNVNFARSLSKRPGYVSLQTSGTIHLSSYYLLPSKGEAEYNSDYGSFPTSAFTTTVVAPGNRASNDRDTNKKGSDTP